MVVKKLTRREALDLVIGAKILANGGGGSEERAVKAINRSYDEGRSFEIGNLSDFKNEEQICIIGSVGGGITEEDKKIVEPLKIVQKEPMVKAVQQLEIFMQVNFRAFVATELGPYNSIVPLMVASLMEGKVAIDGDCCGRSKPKISISTTTVGGVSIFPFSIASQYGDNIIVESTVDDTRGELLARMISRLSNGNISVARCPMTIGKAKEVIIPRTLSLAIELGRTVRKANERGDNPIKAIEKVLPDLQIVFTGKVRSFTRMEEGGFTSGEIVIESINQPSSELKIFYQNEYLLSWLDNKSFITCPDSLLIVDAKTGYGLTPWEEDFEKGRLIVVFAREAPKIWRSKKGLKVIGPQLFDPNWPEYQSFSFFIKE
ncbi:MAG: DUF917 domain-containing protein [Promethearchaeota archaeon]